MQPGNVDDLLQFKDYSDSPSTSPPPAQINVTMNSPTHAFGGNSRRERGNQLSDLIYDMGTMGNLKSNDISSADRDDGDTNVGGSKVSFLTIEYYQQFFNVDTYMVLERITNSIIPKRADGNYLRSNIGQNPDLYGPFWVTVTLIFSIAISGNIASYLQYANEDYHWRYNFHLVSYAATCIFIYANFVPIILWAVFKYSLKPVEEGLETESSGYTPSMLSLICIYGYSLSIYIPVSILWVIQISILQWLLVFTGALLSGIVLITVLSPALRNSKFSICLIILILFAHFLLAAGFMLYFFHVPSNSKNEHIVSVTKAAMNLVKSTTHIPVVGNVNKTIV